MRSILTALQEGRLFELPEADKAHSLEFLARILDANPDIEVGTDTIEEVKHREQECNTGVGLGVAVPHVRARREEGELFCAIGWSTEGIAYDSQDGQKVHLVLMYYIPGAQKNVYLKEISTLVKAIRKTGGIAPIISASDLNTVRNLLLDWVSAAVGEAGPEAVARMIKLEVKQAQAPAAAVVPHTAVCESGTAARTKTAARVIHFSAVSPVAGTVFLLSADGEWNACAEKDPGFLQRLSLGEPFLLGQHQVVPTRTTQYAGGRMLFEGIAMVLPVAG